MGHELTLHLLNGAILRLRLAPCGVDVAVFAHRHMDQRVVFSALMQVDHIAFGDGGHISLNGFKVVLTAAESVAAQAFVALAQEGA